MKNSIITIYNYNKKVYTMGSLDINHDYYFKMYFTRKKLGAI